MKSAAYMILLVSSLSVSHSYGMDTEYVITREYDTQAQSALCMILPADVLPQLFFFDGMQSGFKKMLVLRTTCILWFQALNKANRKNIVESYIKTNNELPLNELLAMALTTASISRSSSMELVNITALPALLLFAGADVNGISKDGKSLMGLATKSQHSLCLSMLIKLGGNVNLQDQEGNTPLHYAAENNALDCVHLLLQKGADKTILNQKGKAPKDCIVFNVKQRNLNAVLQRIYQLLTDQMTVNISIYKPLNSFLDGWIFDY